MTHEEALEVVRAIIIQAFGRDLQGSARGSLVGGYVARIREVMREPPSSSAAPPPCAHCRDLRARLVNIYHLTLNGGADGSIVRSIRDASGPGAPSPMEETDA